MNSFTSFVIQHWELWLAFVVILGVFIVTEIQAHLSNISSISPQDAVNLINREHAVVLDIRDHHSFKAGHIINALSFPTNEIKDKLDELKKYKEKPIIIVCFKGQSAISVASHLKSHGFNQAVCLKGGMTAWQSTGLPVHQE